jgi:hypothetical protein
MNCPSMEDECQAVRAETEYCNEGSFGKEMGLRSLISAAVYHPDAQFQIKESGMTKLNLQLPIWNQ